MEIDRLKTRLSDLESKLLDEKVKENRIFANKGFGYAQRHCKLGNAFTKRGESLRNRIKIIKIQIAKTEENIEEAGNIYTDMAAKAWLKQYGK